MTFLTPDAASDVCYQAQLGPLLFFCEEIAFHRGGKAALRAQREIFHRKITGGLFDSEGDVVRVFQLRFF